MVGPQVGLKVLEEASSLRGSLQVLKYVLQTSKKVLGAMKKVLDIPQKTEVPEGFLNASKALVLKYPNNPCCDQVLHLWVIQVLWVYKIILEIYKMAGSHS